MQGCRRGYLGLIVLFCVAIGCRGRQVGHILKPGDHEMVGSHAAGAEVWGPLVQETAGKLLSRQATELAAMRSEKQQVQPASFDGGGENPALVPEHLAQKRVCFVNIENRGIEELADFREKMYEQIDSAVNAHAGFEMISRRAIDAGLRRCNLAASDLFLPENQQKFAAVMGQINTPVDYLMFGKVTTGSTHDNADSEREYTLSLELVRLQDGRYFKESTDMRKGYTSKLGKIKRYGL